jgi:hypothetical protein
MSSSAEPTNVKKVMFCADVLPAEAPMTMSPSVDL